MALFEKKFCELCGEKAGLLTRAKLADGYLCGGCRSKCSQYLEDFGGMTKEDVLAHLALREENRARYADFRESESLGANGDILVDADHGWFVVAHGSNYRDGNPDVFSFDQIVRTDTRETFETVYPDDGPDHRDSRPPMRRLDHLYLRIAVDHPYVREIEFDALDRITPTPYEIDDAYRSARQIEDAMARMRRCADDYREGGAQPSPQSAAPTGAAAADEILKWKQLLDAGAITQDEFSAKKKQLLGL